MNRSEKYLKFCRGVDSRSREFSAAGSALTAEASAALVELSGAIAEIERLEAGQSARDLQIAALQGQIETLTAERDSARAALGISEAELAALKAANVLESK